MLGRNIVVEFSRFAAVTSLAVRRHKTGAIKKNDAHNFRLLWVLLLLKIRHLPLYI